MGMGTVGGVRILLSYWSCNILFPTMKYITQHCWNSTIFRNASTFVYIAVGALVLMDSLFSVLPSSYNESHDDCSNELFLLATTVSDNVASIVQTSRVRQKLTPTINHLSNACFARNNSGNRIDADSFSHTRYSRAYHVVHRQLLI